jgi:hypothetical protein
MPVGDGTYVVKEMPGPQNMIQWLLSWKVYKVALIMLDVASLASLQLYEKMVERLVMHSGGAHRRAAGRRAMRPLRPTQFP